MITKEKNRTKIICAVVTAISAIVAGGSAFQLYNVQNISQTVNGNVIQILGETGSYVSAGTDLTDSTDELISAYRKVLDENSQYQANQSTLQGQVQSLQNENDDLKNQIQILQLKIKEVLFMLKELRKNKMSVVVTGILFGVMGVLIIPIIAGIVKILGTLSQKYPRIYKYSMIAFIIMLLAISLFYLVIKHQIIFLAIVTYLAMKLCDVIYKRR